MKLRTRLAVAFLTITIVPMLLFYLLVLALSNYQTRSFTKEYRTFSHLLYCRIRCGYSPFLYR